MRRYFFDVHEGTYLHDELGIELEDAAARKQVWESLPMMAAQRKPTATWLASSEWTCQTRPASTSSMPPWRS